MNNIQLDFKYLQLKNVIYEDYQAVNEKNISLNIAKFINLLNKSQIKTYGPIILCLEEINEHLNLKIMTQAKELDFSNKYFKQYKDFRSKRCIYSRFKGNLQNIKFTNKKMEVFAYEKELMVDGREYIVILEYTDSFVTIDLYKQLLSI